MINDNDASSNGDEEGDTDEEDGSDDIVGSYDEESEEEEDEEEEEELEIRGSDDDCEVVDVQKVDVDKNGCAVDQVNEVTIADNSTEKKNPSKPNILSVAENNGEVIPPKVEA